MNTDEKLLKLYGFWRVLTEHEREAIHSSDWIRVGELQSQKRHLQDDILAIYEEVQPNQGAPPFEVRYRTLGQKLILLETENAATMSEKLQETELELKEIDRAGRNLRQVHRAYTHGWKSGWQTYS